ncbi:TPA: hypothetical protein N0F65_003449, partial [Lagenidium giganteum]
RKGMATTCGAPVAFRRLPFRHHHRSFKRLPPPKKVRATQSVSTRAERVKILRWMEEAEAQGTKYLFAVQKERKSVVQHHASGRKRVYIKAASGRGRKRSEWVTWLHIEVLKEFVRLTKLGAKMTNGLILHVAVEILRNATGEINLNAEEIDVAIVTKITPSWVQRFCERFREATSQYREREGIEKEVATHLDEMTRLFERDILEDDMVTNMDETHMLINRDNGVCLTFKGQENVSYQDVLSGGEGMTLAVNLRGGINACLEPSMMIFQKANRSYPIRDVPDNLPSVIYRSGPKGMTNQEVFLFVG